MMYTFHVGTWAGNSGIHRIQFDDEAGTIKQTALIEATNPTYLAYSPDKKTLYATCEEREIGEAANRISGGGVYAFTLDENNGATNKHLVSSGGSYPCHLGIQSGCLIASNYGDGTIAVFDITNQSTSLPTYHQLIRHTGSGANPKRQEGPHAHCAAPVPVSGLLCVTDLGIDAAVFYRPAYSITGTVFMPVQHVQFPAGSGPRHIVFAQCGKVAYAVTELTNEVFTLRNKCDCLEKGGDWEITAKTPALPPTFEGNSACATSACSAIRLSDSGKTLCVSNRGHNSITAYAVDTETGELTLTGTYPSGGKTPRDFNFTHDEKWLIVANQDSNCISVLSIEENYKDTGITLQITKPSCII